MSISLNYTIEIVWLIKGFESYGFGKDKNLYNLKTERIIKQSYNNGSIGYWLNRKFFSLNKIKVLLYKQNNNNTPF